MLIRFYYTISIRFGVWDAGPFFLLPFLRLPAREIAHTWDAAYKITLLPLPAEKDRMGLHLPPHAFGYGEKHPLPALGPGDESMADSLYKIAAPLPG
ncbi:MAG: hypothetical protein IPH12_16390 [Saprospirales bacterium]|nr:hypothetical protein [Saprospirales bacterium]